MVRGKDGSNFNDDLPWQAICVETLEVLLGLTGKQYLFLLIPYLLLISIR